MRSAVRWLPPPPSDGVSHFVARAAFAHQARFKTESPGFTAATQATAPCSKVHEVSSPRPGTTPALHPSNAFQRIPPPSWALPPSDGPPRRRTAFLISALQRRVVDPGLPPAPRSAMSPPPARVAELVDAPDLGSGEATRGGSSPLSRTPSESLGLPAGQAAPPRRAFDRRFPSPLGEPGGGRRDS